MPETAANPPKLLAWTVGVALVAGGAGTLSLFLAAARNTPPILVFLYTGWVLLPYVSLAFARRRLARRSAPAVALMNVFSLVLVAAALTLYVLAALLPHAPRPAAVFLMVPLACQVLTGIGYAVAAMRARPSSSQSPQG